MSNRTIIILPTAVRSDPLVDVFIKILVLSFLLLLLFFELALISIRLLLLP